MCFICFLNVLWFQASFGKAIVKGRGSREDPSSILKDQVWSANKKKERTTTLITTATATTATTTTTTTTTTRPPLGSVWLSVSLCVLQSLVYTWLYLCGVVFLRWWLFLLRFSLGKNLRTFASVVSWGLHTYKDMLDSNDPPKLEFSKRLRVYQALLIDKIPASVFFGEHPMNCCVLRLVRHCVPSMVRHSDICKVGVM